ncbi:MAG: PrsW family intramembrane metalloprotease, partial [Methanoregulaceae archaeon]|nr:PrsW family intramembrane metalloprotease [Methanoregulaceae archaeon]
LSRYAGALAPQAGGNLRVPSQLSPPLPFDTIVLVFVFIFPLYFGSQFYMMAVMNERIGRQGEALLSSPAKPAAIVVGKALPYACGMLLFSAGVTAYLRAPPVILAALVPVILLFLGAALIIGMVSRSFRELSFLSIFFSTVATSYLFFPSIFANIHSIALVSPLTLIVLSIQGTGFTGIEYVYSTALFFVAGTVLFSLGIVNFREEPLFSYERIIPKLRDFLGAWIPDRHRMLSLVFLGAAVIPFVFLVQMMLLVLVFNLPLSLSLPLLLVSAAFVEELAKSTVLAAAVHRFPSFLSWRTLAVASCAIAAGFLIGEKLLLLVSLSEITGSVFGTILFTSLQALWLPFLLHATGVLSVGAGMKAGLTLGKPRLGFVTGLVLATAVHFLYNAAILRGWLI